MRDTSKYGNLYYAEIFIVDMKSYDYVYSVGIDLLTNKYMLEYSKCIEQSFVSYSENSYTIIDYKKYLELLEQAFINNNVSEELYKNLKQRTKPDIGMIKNLAECYERIAKRDIQEKKKCVYIPSKLKIGDQHLYHNYDNFCDKNNFTKLYLKRYSKNQGWCVRLVENDAGYKLSVVYSANKLPDLYEENEYIKFLKKYNSDVDFYREYDVYFWLCRK